MAADSSLARIAALEAELAALRAEMQDFTYTVSHDLRASLRHIVSYAHLVQEDAGPQLDEEVQGFLATITDSAKHMGLLMDGLMELSRLGTVAVQLEPVSLQSLLSDLCEGLSFSHPQRNIVWKVHPNLPEVLADATLLRQALQAVLENAVKFSSPREDAVIEVGLGIAAGHVGADLHASAVEGVDAVVSGGGQEGLQGAGATVLPLPPVILQVQDNGVGYNPALQGKLFHAFQRLHSAKQFEGIGMGLALARKSLSRMNATIAARGEVNAGCCISISLPPVP